MQAPPSDEPQLRWDGDDDDATSASSSVAADANDKGVWCREATLQVGRYHVFRCRHSHTGQRSVVKVADRPSVWDGIRQDVAILSRVRHRNVIEMIDAGVVMGRPYVTTRLAEMGDLHHYFKRVWEGEAEEKGAELLRFFRQLVDGLQHLHSRGISHGDVKPGNLLVAGPRRTLKIVDFEFALHCPDPNICYLNRPYGTECYMAPEIHHHLPHSPLACDVWSSGVTFLHLLTGYAWRTPSAQDAKFARFMKWRDLKCPVLDLSEDQEFVLLGMIDLEPLNRMTWNEIRATKWFNSSP